MLSWSIGALSLACPPGTTGKHVITHCCNRDRPTTWEKRALTASVPLRYLNAATIAVYVATFSVQRAHPTSSPSLKQHNSTQKDYPAEHALSVYKKHASLEKNAYVHGSVKKNGKNVKERNVEWTPPANG
jgi:hypothetical protein